MEEEDLELLKEWMRIALLLGLNTGVGLSPSTERKDVG